VPVDEVEDARLPADADELDDVGEVELGERALEGHGGIRLSGASAFR
jgi:hypothetical protein